MTNSIKSDDQSTENSHQQQILFDESEPLVKQSLDEGNLNSFEPQILFEETDNLPILVAEEEEENELTSNRQLAKDAKEVSESTFSLMWRIILSLFSIIIIIESTLFFIEGFTSSPIITSLYAALFSALAILGARSLWQEIVGLKQFKKQQKLKTQATCLLSQNPDAEDTSIDSAVEYCQKLSDSLPCDLTFDNGNGYEEWKKSASEGHSSKEIVQLYSRVVLTHVDERALNEVAKFSTEAVVLVSLSPVAIIDMLIMLTRNLRMINKIAGLYGLKLGYWSRIKLIKQVFVNMVYAGASEILSDFGNDIVGAELLGKLSTRFAQGLGAGMLTARLGIKTMQLCRPIPFDDKPKLNHVRKKIVKQIKGLLESNKK
jgi:putative membrane protein